MKSIHRTALLLFLWLSFSLHCVIAQGTLHRLDFRLEGKSCASCLLAIQRRIKALSGVREAVVMLKRPFGASVIYETDKTSEKEIIAVVKDKDTAVKILEIKDQAITDVPLPLIPPFVPGN